MDIGRTRIPVTLDNGAVAKFEVSQSGKQEVSLRSFSFSEISEVLEGVSESIKASVEKVKPQKVSVTFGIEVGIESGKLTAIIVKGASTANLEITLEWDNSIAG